MLIHPMLPQGKNFKAKLQIRATTHFVLALVGAVLLCIVPLLLRLLPNAANSYLASLLPGTGLGLLLMGGLQFGRTQRILRSPEKLQAQCLLENDERLLAIRAQVLSICIYLLSLGLYLGVIISAFFSPLVSQTLLVVLCLLLLIIFGVNRLLLSRY